MDEKNRNVFIDNGVLSDAELHSRYEIYLEKYRKTIRVEALTMLEMLKKDILPAVSVFEGHLKDAVLLNSELDLPYKDSYEYKTLKQSLAYKKKVFADLTKMEKILKEEPQDNLEKALHCRKMIVPLMEELRKNTDELEKITDRNLWPIPSYLELLFGID
jgi:glutamine synthetase